MEKDRLLYLLERYRSDTADADERNQLQQWLDAGENSEGWLEAMEDQLSLFHDPAFDFTPHAVVVNKVLAIDKKNGSSTTVDVVDRPIVRRMYRWSRVAAAVLILAIGAYLFFIPRKSASPVAVVKNTKDDLLPGSNKALLTLSDGSTIALDDASQGAIARQGNASIVKRPDGGIVYQAAGASPVETMINTMTTPRGGQYQLTLPDGTRVWLNAASSVTYPAVFTGRERRIKVTGEVFLEVEKDKTRPFFVDVAGQSVIEVLGTSFNINAYNDEAATTMTLVEGSMRVQPASGNPQAVMLQPGQQAVVQGAQWRIDGNVNINQVTAWKRGLFDFTNMDIAAILRQLARWYDFEVQFEGTPSADKFRGKISRNLRLSEVLELLRILHLQFTIDGKKLIVQELKDENL